MLRKFRLHIYVFAKSLYFCVTSGNIQWIRKGEFSSWSPRNSSRESNPAKNIKIIYEFCLARHKHDVLIATVPESWRMTELVEL